MHRRRNSFASSSARLSRLYRILPTLTLITVEQVVLAQPQIWRCGSGLLWMYVRKISPQTGIRSPPISGPRSSFLVRSRRGSRSPASAVPIPARTLSGSCAATEQSDPELRSFCWILRRRGDKKGSSKQQGSTFFFFFFFCFTFTIPVEII